MENLTLIFIYNFELHEFMNETELQSEITTWTLYFPEMTATVFNRDLNMINRIIKDLKIDDLNLVHKIGIYKCPFSFYKKYPNILCINCAISEIIFIKLNKIVLVETRIENCDTIFNKFVEIDQKLVGKFVCVRGIVSKVGMKKFKEILNFYECINCNTIIQKSMNNNIYKAPGLCTGCKKSKTYKFLPNHPKANSITKQELKIQQIIPSDNQDVLNVDVYGEFIGICSPGDILEISGLVRAELVGGFYEIRIECNNLKKIENIANFSEEDINEFNLLSKEKNILGIFMNSLYPNIVGNELIKIGLILSLFGGTKKELGKSSSRGAIHILILGDPGLGKSKMLKDTSEILPKSTYSKITGNNELCLTITPDNTTGEFIIAAGPLIISNNGICCLDDLENLNDFTILINAMEDQQVATTRSGISSTYSTDCSILASANSKGGSYNNSKTINENVKLDPSLLSRFDLIYILQDNLSIKENYEISNQILRKRPLTTSTVSSQKILKLVSRIRTPHNELFTPTDKSIDPEFIQKYILYSKSMIHPKLSTTAQQKIKDTVSKNPNFNTKTLETLWRLTESISRMELMKVASEKHASLAIKLFHKIQFDKKSIVEKNKKKDFSQILKSFMSENERSFISKSELKNLIVSHDPIKYIEVLNYKGILVKKGKDEYKINL